MEMSQGMQSENSIVVPFTERGESAISADLIG